MIVLHVHIECADDYAARREPHRRAHIQRLEGLRAAGAMLGGGPAPDGRTVELVYRLQRPEQLKPALEEDPYWTGGAWSRYTARSFAEFVEPWELPPIVLDGSRAATVVEGPATDRDMAQFALIEMRGAGRLAFGGFLDDGRTWALCRTADAAQACDWFTESGFWVPGTLTGRPLLHVL
jgi:uncharacterized protein YciI